MGSYVTVSTKVRKEFLRRKLKEEVEKREVELITRRLSELSNVLDAIDIERLVRHVREDRRP